MTLLLYLSKVLLCSAILFGYYWLFLRNKQFHHYNRYYLLAALLLSVLLPFIKIPVLYQPENTVNRVVYQTIDVLTARYWEAEPGVAQTSLWENLFTLQNAVYLFYSLGIAWLLVLVFKSYLHIRKMARQYPHEVIQHLKFYHTDEPGTPFSFFRSIFWNNQLEFNSHAGQQIFRHELFHVQQKHSVDIVLTEILTALFWYNPFFHLMKKELKAIHEFLADRYTISNNDRYAYAELLVHQMLAGKKNPISTYFFHNHIKRRIAMITKLKTKKYSYWSRLMVLPIAALLFCAFTLYVKQPVKAGENSLHLSTGPLTVIIDPGHGGEDKGATSYDERLTEKDLALRISQKIQQLAPSYNVKVIMTRDGDYMPGNAASVSDGLKYRTSLIEQHQADLFISIHVSAAPKVKKGNEYVAAPQNGFELFITNRNETTMNDSKKLGTSLLKALNSIYTLKSSSILQREGKGIYVLDKATCPAVLLECGFITSEKDVAFISNPANQEAIARKVLEGMVNFKNQTATTSSGGTAIQPEIISNEKEEWLKQVLRHYKRNLRYPKDAVRNNAQGSFYFSANVAKDGTLSNYHLYNNKPDVPAEDIQQIVIAAIKPVNIIEQMIITEVGKAALENEIKRVTEKPVEKLTFESETPKRVYFKFTFRLEKPIDKDSDFAPNSPQNSLMKDTVPGKKTPIRLSLH